MTWSDATTFIIFCSVSFSALPLDVRLSGLLEKSTAEVSDWCAFLLIFSSTYEHCDSIVVHIERLPPFSCILSKSRFLLCFYLLSFCY